MRSGTLMNTSQANDYDLEQSDKLTNIEANKLSLENARLANESTKIDNDAKKAALRNQGASSQMTNEFLTKWGDMNKETLDVLKNTLNGIYSGNSPSTGIYGDIINNIKNQISTFDTQYGGTTQQLMDSTMSDVNARRGLVSNLTNMAKPDYEGVSGRAAADVGTQSEVARGEMSREAMSYGIDPTSGKFGALQKKSFLGEARNKVDAMNKARVAEKERSAGLTTTAINAIDPNVTGTLAMNLMNQKGNLLGLQTQAAGAMSAAEKAKADTALGVAQQMGNIGEQYGSLGSTMMGLNAAGVGVGSKRELSIPERIKQREEEVDALFSNG